MTAIRDLMTPRPTCVQADETLESCARRMVAGGFRHLLVVDEDGSLTGVLYDLALRSLEDSYGSQASEPDPGALVAPTIPVSMFMNLPGLTVSPEEAVERVLRRWLETAQDVVVVVDEDHKPVGIVTEHDVVRWAIKQGIEGSIRLSEGGRLVSLGRDGTRTRAQELLEEHKVRHLLVLDGGALYGVLSYRDLVRTGMPSGAVPVESAPDRFDVRVGDEVGRAPVTIGPGTSLQEAARTMVKLRIGCLPIVNADHRPIGIVTRRDVLRAVLEG